MKRTSTFPATTAAPLPNYHLASGGLCFYPSLYLPPVRLPHAWALHNQRLSRPMFKPVGSCVWRDSRHAFACSQFPFADWGTQWAKTCQYTNYVSNGMDVFRNYMATVRLLPWMLRPYLSWSLRIPFRITSSCGIPSYQQFEEASSAWGSPTQIGVTAKDSWTPSFFLPAGLGGSAGDNGNGHTHTHTHTPIHITTSITYLFDIPDLWYLGGSDTFIRYNLEVLL